MPTIGFGDISDFLGAFADLFGFLDFISGSVEACRQSKSRRARSAPPEPVARGALLCFIELRGGVGTEPICRKCGSCWPSAWRG